MSKTIYQHAVEPLGFDERIRRLEHQVIELTEKVAWLTAHAMATTGEPVPAGTGGPPTTP